MGRLDGNDLNLFEIIQLLEVQEALFRVGGVEQVPFGQFELPTDDLVPGLGVSRDIDLADVDLVFLGHVVDHVGGVGGRDPASLRGLPGRGRTHVHVGLGNVVDVLAHLLPAEIILGPGLELLGGFLFGSGFQEIAGDLHVGHLVALPFIDGNLDVEPVRFLGEVGGFPPWRPCTPGRGKTPSGGPRRC